MAARFSTVVSSAIEKFTCCFTSQSLSSFGFWIRGQQVLRSTGQQRWLVYEQCDNSLFKHITLNGKRKNEFSPIR